MRGIIITMAAAIMAAATCQAQSFDFDLTEEVPAYSDETGYGFDLGTSAPGKRNTAPSFFSVKVPDGNWKVSVTLGSRSYASRTLLRAETRRMLADEISLGKNEFLTLTFCINVHSTKIDGERKVGISMREAVDVGWDEKLTLEINGAMPAVSRITVEPDTVSKTVWLCGDSTVVDQDADPYTSWGQILPYWLDSGIAVANLANSGLTTTSFLNQNRLEKILHDMRPGDWVVVEFGHNDEKDRAPGSGAWYNYSFNLKTYIDRIRQKGGNVILATPTERRSFSDGKAGQSHGDYPEAARQTARREDVPMIDLTAGVGAMYDAFGEEGSKCLLVHYPAGTYRNQPTDLADNTHFSPFGAFEVCKLVVDGLVRNGITDITDHLREPWKGFDPKRPDDPAAFYWPVTPSLARKLEKPAGY